MTDASITLGIDGRPAQQGADVVKQALGGVKKEAGATVTAVDNNTKAFERLKQATFSLRGAFAGLATALSAREIIRYSDTWKLIESRLENATKSAVKAKEAQRDLYDSAQRNRVAFEGQATLYARLAAQSDQLGLSHNRLMTVVNAVSQSFKISGASTMETTQAIRQLSQAMGSGVLRGDEFNSIMENAPRLQKAIADSLGVTIGRLREMAEKGELSAKRVTQAIEEQAKVINGEFAKIPVTVQDALVKVDNAFLRFIGRSEAVAAGTTSIALALSALADNFDAVATAAVSVGAAIALNYTASAITAVAATGTLTAALATLGATLAIVVPVAAVGAAIYAVITYFDELKAAGTLVVGTIAAGFMSMGEFIAGFGRGMVRSLIVAFQEAKRIAESFAKDVVRLVRDPLNFSGFSSPNLSGAAGNIGAAFTDEWKKAEAASRSYGAYFNELIDDTVINIKRKQDAQNGDNRALDDYKKTLDAVSKADALGKQAESAGKAKKATEAVKKVTQETAGALDTVGQKSEEVAQIFKDTATGIQQAFTGAFRDLLDGGNGFRKLASSIWDIFKTMLANMATLAIASPIIVPVVQSIGGALGLGSDAIGSITGQLGGGSKAGSAIQTGAGILGKISGLTAGLDAWGASALPSVFGMAAGPTATGAAGYGVGALSSMGLSLSSVALPIAGLAVGMLASKLFKKKPSSGLQSGSFDLASGAFLDRGGLTGSKFNQANFDAVSSLGETIGSLARIFGTTGDIQLASGNRRGLEYALTDNASVFDTDNPLRKSFKTANELIKSLTDEFAKQAGENLNASLATAVKNIDFGKTEEALKQGLEDLVFAAGFDKLGETVPYVTESRKAMDEINASFDKAADTAKRLGLAEEKVEAARRKALDTLRSNANQASLNSLYEVTDPTGLARYNEQLRFSKQLQEVKDVNGNLEAVYALHRLNMLRIDDQFNREETQKRIDKLQAEGQKADSLVQSYSRIAETLKNSITSMRLGNLSTLSPLAKLEESRSLFASTLEKALTGTVDERIAASEALPAIGQGLLELSQAYNSSNEIFASDFSNVQRGLEAARQNALTQTDIQVSIANAAWQQVAELQTGFSALQQAIASLGALGKVGGIDPYTATAANAAGRSLSEKTSNGLTVGQIESTARALLGGYTGATGSGELSKMLAERGLNDAFSAALRTQGAKGFADGGTPFATPFIVGERGQEVIADRRSAMVIPFQQNAAILREMESINRELRAQNRILQDGMQQQIKEARATRENTGRIADETVVQKRKNRA